MKVKGSTGKKNDTQLQRLDSSLFPENMQNSIACRMGSYEKYLCLGIMNLDNGGNLYRSLDGKNYEAIATKGFGNKNNFAIISYQWFKGKLYVTTWNMADSLEMYRGNAEEKNIADIVWESITKDGFGDNGNKAGTSLTIFKDYLYVGCFNPVTGPEIWRSLSGDPGTWVQVNQDGWLFPGNSDATTMLAYNGYLYVGTESELPPYKGCQLWRTDGNLYPPYNQWELVNTTGFGDPLNHNISGLNVFKDKIYASTWNAISWEGSRNLEGEKIGVEVWRATPSETVPFKDWELVSEKGFGDAKMVSTSPIIVHKDTLYLGTNTHSTTGGLSGIEGGLLMKTKDGMNWERIYTPGFLDPPSQGPSWGLYEFQDQIFIADLSTDKKLDLWVYKPSD